MKLLKDYSSADLRRIISIKEQIETLQTELEAFGGETGNGAVGEPIKRGRRRMSASARRKIGLAQKARWAKVKGIEVAPVARKRRRMSAAGRARIAAAAKARWAKFRGSRRFTQSR
ncbi:MAG TPA: hypothetical protein VGO67_18860 [Verrucomicrobiae bacterium]|jgi:hypothetical protein